MANETLDDLKRERALSSLARMREHLAFSPHVPEDQVKAFENFFIGVHMALEPEDAIEEIWTIDFAWLNWEVQRLRKISARILPASAAAGVRQLTREMFGADRAQDLTEAWARGDEEARREVENALQRAGHNAAAIEARTFSQTLKANDLIERQIVSTEKRRDQSLRQLDGRRESLARRARAELEREILARGGRR